MLDSEVIFQTVGKYFVNKNSSDFEILLKLFSKFHLFFTSFKRVGVNITQVNVAEEVKERFSLNLLGNDSLLSSLFVLLFLFDFFKSKVLSNPFNNRGLRFNWSTVLEVEFFSEFLILNDFIFSKVEDNGKVVTSFLINNVNVLDAVK